MLVYDITSASSFNDITRWIDTIDEVSKVIQNVEVDMKGHSRDPLYCLTHKIFILCVYMHAHTLSLSLSHTHTHTHTHTLYHKHKIIFLGRT